MGLLDNITKKAKEAVATASKAYEDTSKTIREKTIGELIDSAKDVGHKIISNGSITEQSNPVDNKKENSDKSDKEISRKSSHSSLFEDILESIFD